MSQPSSVSRKRPIPGRQPEAEGAGPLAVLPPAGSNPVAATESPADASLPSSAPERHCATCKCGQPKKKRSGGIKRTSADARFSSMIRERAKWRCEWPGCGKLYEPPTTVLQCAHMFSRRIAATRTDPDNAAALCYPHHVHVDGNPAVKTAFFRERLGDEAFDALAARAHAKRNRIPSGGLRG